jgi:hypothetical protein
LTLALYGKSRRRQGALLGAALLAIIIATIGGLSLKISAFATGGGPGNNNMGQIVLSSSACVVENNIQYAQFHFLIPASAGVGQGAGGTLSGTYNDGAAKNFGPINEDTTPSNGHPDWTFTIPFGSANTVQVLTATSSSGYFWPATGAGREKDTVDKSSCAPVIGAPNATKAPANPSYSSGYAYWNITINNSANAGPVEVKVTDNGAELVSTLPSGCAGTDLSTGITCTVAARSTLTIPVKKAAAQQCTPSQVENTATVEWRVPNANQWTSLGTVNGGTITIPADTTKCDKPGIVKSANASQTTDPNAVTWTVTVTNPATGSNGTSLLVRIKDQNVTVTSGPNYTGNANCTPDTNSTFAADLNSNAGVLCSMPNNSSITFTVKPNPAPIPTCKDQVFTNTAYLYSAYLDIGTNSPVLIAEAQGGSITLLGNPDLCKKTILVCKVLENNNDGITRTGAQFTINVSYNNQVQRVVNLAVDEGKQACDKVTVPANATVSVSEGDRPKDWMGDWPGYPKVTKDGDTFTVTNKELPTVEVTFVKKICDTFKDVPRNSGGAPVHIGAPYFQLTANDLGTTEGPSCKTVTDWQFELWTSNTSNSPWPGNNPTGGTKFGTYSTGTHTLTQAEVQHLSANGRLFVRELYQPGYAFATLKCEGDNRNHDNWEWMFWSAAQDGKVTCTAYNVPATKEITIEKTFVGVETVTKDDYPTFTFTPSVDAACTGPVISGTTATWTCTVPYTWNGTVTETPAKGWEQCKRDGGGGEVYLVVAGNGPQTFFTFSNCKKPKITVKKVVTNVENDTTQFTVTLSGGQSSQTGQIAEAGTNGPVNATFEVSVGGPYTITEGNQNGYQVLGWNYAGENGVCPAGPALETGATANLGDLKPGANVVICFYNKRFGDVVVDKQAPSGSPAPGTTFNWTISVSVATGPTSSVLTLSDTLPAGFTYGPIITSDSALNCSLSGLNLTCTLNAGTGPGTYTVTIPATAPTGTFDICEVEHENTVTFDGAGIKGSDSATVKIGCVATTGRILVKKVVLGPGQASDPTFFTATISGPGITGTRSESFSQQTPGLFLGLTAGTFTVSEAAQAGYTYAGWAFGTITGDTVQCPANPTSTDANALVTITNVNPQAAICFYNDPKVTVRVHKTLNVIGLTSHGAGWQFTISGCNITPQTKTTDANGIAEFTDLPPAIGCSYQVTETVQTGWTPQFVTQYAQPTKGGEVAELDFLNIRVYDPPCVDPNDARCTPPPPPSTPTPTATPTTPGQPTPSATPPTPGQPTNTPTATPTNTPTPTPTNTPVTTVAGERTPGPGQSPTPLAPATGYGLGPSQGGMNLLLVVAGLISLSLGLGFLALGRRRSDR